MLSQREPFIYEGKITPSVTEILNDVFGISFPDNISVERATAFGNYGHEAIANTLKLKVVCTDINIKAYVDNAFNFIHSFGYIPVMIEERLYSKKYRITGKMDLIVRDLGGYHHIIDWKTGQIGKTAHLQLAGYELLAEDAGIRINKRICVQLNGEKGYKVKTYDNKQDKYDFLHCVSFYNLKKELKL